MRRWLPNEKVVANAPRLNNRPVRWQRSSLYDNPLLFVIPSEARDLQFRRPFVEMFF
jgi:hypothetical protein